MLTLVENLQSPRLLETVGDFEFMFLDHYLIIYLSISGNIALKVANAVL